MYIYELCAIEAGALLSLLQLYRAIKVVCVNCWCHCEESCFNFLCAILSTALFVGVNVVFFLFFLLLFFVFLHIYLFILFFFLLRFYLFSFLFFFLFPSLLCFSYYFLCFVCLLCNLLCFVAWLLFSVVVVVNVLPKMSANWTFYYMIHVFPLLLHISRVSVIFISNFPFTIYNNNILYLFCSLRMSQLLLVL